jgi:Protein of unknown function DUF262
MGKNNNKNQQTKVGKGNEKVETIKNKETKPVTPVAPVKSQADKKEDNKVVAIASKVDEKATTTPVKVEADKNTENTVATAKENTVVVDKKDDVKAESKSDTKVDDKKADVKADGKKEDGNKSDDKTPVAPKATKKIDKVEEVVVPFARQTRIEKSNNNRTIKNLYKNKDKLRFDLAIQRNEVWTQDQKSMLIHSILYGYPIPPVMVAETDDDNIWFLDGKQRLTTIVSFLSGEWALSKKTPSVFGHEIKGFKFADLQEDMQDVIYDETITLIKLKGMTEEETDNLFVRWNSGSALSKIELTRAMHSALIEQINHISDLEFFAEDIALTGKARNRFVDQEIILQIAMLLDEGKDNIKGFGSSQISEYVLRLKDTDQVLSDELIKKFESISHYLNMAVADFDHSERTKALKKIHVPMIFFTAQKAIDLKVKPSLFGDFIRTFLITNYSVESDYGQSCQAGSSKKDNVQIRLYEMDMQFGEFLSVIEDTATSVTQNKQDSEKINKGDKSTTTNNFVGVGK